MSRSFVACIAATCAAFVTAVPASALTMKECSAKFQAAKSAGTLKEKNWQEFRKAQCGAAGGAGGGATGALPGPTFPTAVSPKYSQESAGKARMHTCLDQYRANKASNKNGGLRWIQRGGGYYSECTKQLKG
jgi:hypothetical protein